MSTALLLNVVLNFVIILSSNCCFIIDNNQLTDMTQVFFECCQNSSQTVRDYAASFSKAEVSDRNKFKSFERSFSKYEMINEKLLLEKLRIMLVGQPFRKS